MRQETRDAGLRQVQAGALQGIEAVARHEQAVAHPEFSRTAAQQPLHLRRRSQTTRAGQPFGHHGVGGELRAVGLAAHRLVLQRQREAPAVRLCLAVQVRGQRGDTIDLHRLQSIAGQPGRPVFVADAERRSEQAPRAAAIDVEVRGVARASGEQERADVSVRADVHVLDLVAQFHGAELERLFAQQTG